MAKVIDVKYQMRIPVDHLNTIHNQIERMEQSLDYAERFDLDTSYKILIGKVKPRDSQLYIDAMVKENPDLKIPVIKELFSRYKSTMKRELKDYTYRPQDAVYLFKSLLKNKMRGRSEGGEVDATYETYEWVIEQYRKEHSDEELGAKLAEHIEGYPGEWYIDDNPITIEANDYTRAKDINKAEYSDVRDSSFFAYYYYHVVADIFGEKIDGYNQVSRYISAGWN